MIWSWFLTKFGIKDDSPVRKSDFPDMQEVVRHATRYISLIREAQNLTCTS